jgi:hypothetical protein
MEITWEPAARDCRITAVVAEPEEKAKANFPFSNAAIAFSKFCRFGLAERVYSNPMGFPTAVCAKVVESVIWKLIQAQLIELLTGSMTAPEVGSIGEPAWTASVPKP